MNVDKSATNSIDLLVVTGPTATGKTKLAAHLAHQFNGEIISADSRQVYRGMDLATGKDLSDYEVMGQQIPFHLVDIFDPGYEYNVFEFQNDFLNCYQDITSRKKLPVLCGGTGMYVESVLRGYRLIQVPENPDLRRSLGKKQNEELRQILRDYKLTHNTSDLLDRRRLIRAIEIQSYEQDHPHLDRTFPRFHYKIVAPLFDRKIIRQRITTRLKARLDAGMENEAKELLAKGLSPDQLKFYGLEYRYLTQYVTGELSYDEMFAQLNTAIHQFAKRQMTWFRKMERNGIPIHWIDGNLSMDEKVRQVRQYIESF